MIGALKLLSLPRHNDNDPELETHLTLPKMLHLKKPIWKSKMDRRRDIDKWYELRVISVSIEQRILSWSSYKTRKKMQENNKKNFNCV